MSQPTFLEIDASGHPVTYFTENPNGQTIMANSHSVTIASDQTPIPVSIAASLPPTPWQFTFNASGIAANGTQTAKAAGGAGIRNYVTGIQISSSTVVTASTLTINDGTTVIWNATIPSNGVISVPFTTPLQGSAATDLKVTLTGGLVGGTYSINLQGYQQ